MTREKAAERIVLIWLTMPIPLVALLTAQTLGGKYGDDSGQAWSWLLAQLAPILALVMASAFSSPSRAWREKAANRFRWRCAVLTSSLYGTTILAFLLMEPLLRASPYDVFSASAWLLTLLQGSVVACLGAVIFDGR